VAAIFHCLTIFVTSKTLSHIRLQQAPSHSEESNKLATYKTLDAYGV